MNTVILRQKLIEAFRRLSEPDQWQVINLAEQLVRTRAMEERRSALGSEQCLECRCLKAGHHVGGCEGLGGNCPCNLKYY